MTRITKVLVVVLSLLFINIALIESRRILQRSETSWGVNARGREIQQIEKEGIDKRYTIDAPANTLCQNAQLITIPNGGKVEYEAVYSQGTQPDTLLRLNGPCVASPLDRIVYYKFVGNGKAVEISTCNEQIKTKQIITSINVFENFETCNIQLGGSCVAGGSQNVGEECSAARFCTTNGATYYVAVGIFSYNEQSDFGTYKFSIESIGDCSPLKNDQCERAIEIFTGIEIEGNTYFNKPSEQNHECCRECEDIRFVAASWYSIKGLDSMFRASTTNPADTILRVYSRPSNASPCSITTGDFLCENGHDQYYKGELTWFAKLDVTYYILVSGYQGIEENFVLTVENLDSARQLCQPASELCQNCPPCGEACTEETNVNFYLSNLVQAN